MNGTLVAAIAASLCFCLTAGCGDSASNKAVSDSGAPTLDGGREGGASSGGTRGSGGRPGDVDAESSSGGTENSPDASPDAEVPVEGDCPNEGDPAKASLCLTFDPEPVTFQETPDLDGKGILFVSVFRSATPAGSADVIASTVYPSTPTGYPAVELGALPELRFSGLPDVVYVRTHFVDNLAGLESESGLAYGMFVGGIDLADGIRPSGGGAPKLRKVTLTAGRGTSIKQKLTALRRFTTTVALALPAGAKIPDDAEGPLSVGAFGQRLAVGAPVFGGAELPCVDLKKGPVHATGYFYVQGMPESGTEVYFGGQLDDFGRKILTPPGALVSATTDLLIPETQTVMVMPGDYSVSIDRVSLNFVIPGYDGFAPFACPDSPPTEPDAGTPGGGPKDASTMDSGRADSGNGDPVQMDSGL